MCWIHLELVGRIDGSDVYISKSHAHAYLLLTLVHWISNITDSVIQIIIYIIKIISYDGIVVQQIHIMFNIRCCFVHIDGRDNFHKNHFNRQYKEEKYTNG